MARHVDRPLPVTLRADGDRVISVLSAEPAPTLRDDASIVDTSKA
jgi:hypothetical protein